MRESTVSEKVKSWSRIAASVGVLLAEPKVRAKMEALLKDRLGSMGNTIGDTISEKYDDVAHRVGDATNVFKDRVGNATDALRGRNNKGRMVAFASFAIGLSVGAGLGILLAPTSGRAARSAMDAASAAVGKATRSIA